MDGNTKTELCGCACAQQLVAVTERLDKLEALFKDKGSTDIKPATSLEGQARKTSSGKGSPGSSETAEVPEGAGDHMPMDLPMAMTRVLMQQLCLPMHCDLFGRCLGGKVLSWIDLAAAFAAGMAANGPIVTASVDAVHFVKPLHVGRIAILEAMVNCTFSSSMEVEVRVLEEDPTTGQRIETCNAFLTFVALKSLRKQGNASPKLLPRLVAEGKDQEALLTNAEKRRQQRLEKRKADAGKEPARLPPADYRNITVPNTRLVRVVSKAEISKELTVTPADTTSHMIQYVMPGDANPAGITFGGQVLAWVEQAAFLSATRLSVSGHMVTAAMDAVNFQEPTTVGDIIYFTSAVTATFTSSVEVMVSVYAQRPSQLKLGVFFVMDAFVTLVAMSDNGMPQPLQLRLSPSTDVERRREEEAKGRREARKGLQASCHRPEAENA